MMETKDLLAPEPKDDFEWDVFIAHASEDKDACARQLANPLNDTKVAVWYDEFRIEVGDSLRRSIDEGFSRSRFGIVMLSPNFFAKEWPQRELDGLATRDLDTRKVILPVWLDVDVARYSPPLADRRAAKARDGMDEVVESLLRVLRPSGPEGAVAARTKGIT
jgi:hypothetical protein